MTPQPYPYGNQRYRGGNFQPSTLRKGWNMNHHEETQFRLEETEQMAHPQYSGENS